jgi:hypothetical protein|tara:strand:- start:14205 stop:14468 length:264 start_codon:yes stop_codon:yes gene_type:complete
LLGSDCGSTRDDAQRASRASRTLPGISGTILLPTHPGPGSHPSGGISHSPPAAAACDWFTVIFFDIFSEILSNQIIVASRGQIYLIV